MQQRVGLDLRDGELQVVAEFLRLCARRVHVHMPMSYRASKGTPRAPQHTGNGLGMQPAKGCESASMQQRVVLDLGDGELKVVAECLRLCARRGRSRGDAAVVGRSNKGQLQEQRVM